LTATATFSSIKPLKSTPTTTPSAKPSPTSNPDLSLQLTYLVENKLGFSEVYAITLQCPIDFPPCLSEPRLLFRYPWPISTLSWSPDGQHVAFSAAGYGGTRKESLNDIYVANWDGSNVFNVTRSQVHDTNPTWSPNGGLLAYYSWDILELTGIYITPPDGSKKVKLPNSELIESPFQPVWTPEVNEIAFIATPIDWSARFQIYFSTLDGSSLSQVTSEKEMVNWFSYSGDGRWIAFDDFGIGYDEQKKYEIETHNIYLIQTDGSRKTRLTLSENNRQYFPSWSPVSDWIAFGGLDSYDIFIIKPNGTNLIQVTRLPGEGKPTAWRLSLREQ
jgi:Tol biopolymer transport system component